MDEVSLHIERGELFGILGPNGGGKSTLFRILSTMLTPNIHSGGERSVGTIQVMGHDVLDEPARVRQRLGVLFQSPSLDGQLTANENLLYHGQLYGLSGKTLTDRIDRWLTFFDLQARRDDYVDRFSGGMRRKLELAKALLHEPALLLMDEPATGLDPGARRTLWQQVGQIRKDTGMTVVFTTHLMDEAERCDRLAIMSEGRIVAVDTPTNLQSQIGGDVVTITPEPELDEAACRALLEEITERFGPWEEGMKPELMDGHIRFEKSEGAKIAGEVHSAFPGKVRSLTVGRPTLEDVFLHMTGAQLVGERHEEN